MGQCFDKKDVKVNATDPCHPPQRVRSRGPQGRSPKKRRAASLQALTAAPSRWPGSTG